MEQTSSVLLLHFKIDYKAGYSESYPAFFCLRFGLSLNLKALGQLAFEGQSGRGFQWAR